MLQRSDSKKADGDNTSLKIDIDFAGLANIASLIDDDKTRSQLLNALSDIEKKVNKCNTCVLNKMPDGIIRSLLERLELEVNDDSSPLKSLNGYDEETKSYFREIHKQIDSSLKLFKLKYQKSQLVDQTGAQNLLSYQQNLVHGTDEFKVALSKIKKIQKYSYVKIYICHGAANEYGEKYLCDESLSWVLPFIKKLYADLSAAGIHVVTNPSSLTYSLPIFKLMDKIRESNFVLLLGSQMLLERHDKKSDVAIHTELNYIRHKRNQAMASKLDNNIIPVLIEGAPELSFPTEFTMYLTMQNWVKSKTYFQNVSNLISQLYAANNHTPIWDEYLKSISPDLRAQIAPDYKLVVAPSKTDDVKNMNVQAKSDSKVVVSNQKADSLPLASEIPPPPPAYDAEDHLQASPTPSQVVYLVAPQASPIVSLGSTASVITVLQPPLLTKEAPPLQKEVTVVPPQNNDAKRDIIKSLQTKIDSFGSKLSKNVHNDFKKIFETLIKFNSYDDQVLELVKEHNNRQPNESPFMATEEARNMCVYKIIQNWFIKDVSKKTLEQLTQYDVIKDSKHKLHASLRVNNHAPVAQSTSLNISLSKKANF